MDCKLNSPRTDEIDRLDNKLHLSGPARISDLIYGIAETSTRSLNSISCNGTMRPETYL